ncbi:hypothetical protein PILCRDRAFT_89303 [Piloderma croceum F 1598]|uniref:Uncharacterized protein n=1 Tax=Piloderma croceum (strain F 1598) TaxID=765440 RepID=A0A0C3B458_PILCF|nr:hypothetical protein PILCRDRAFT_89303 [Piloderma croceum F 1598]
MLPSKSFLSLLLITISLSRVIATPIPCHSKVTLKFAHHLNILGFLNIANADQARAKALKSLLHRKHGGQRKRASTFMATNEGAIYTANIGVGSPATESPSHGLAPIEPTVMSKQAPAKALVSQYQSIMEKEDSLALNTIGVASASSRVNPADGILGIILVTVTSILTLTYPPSIGPVDLTMLVGSLTKIPTVTDNLFVQGATSTEAITSVSDGELTFGAV